MNLKKLIAGIVSAAILATTAIVTPVVANAENDVTVTVNVDTNWFSGVIFTDAAVDVTVNQNDKTGANWVQVDRQTWNEETKTNTDNDYTAAFGNSSESGYTQSFTFTTGMSSVSATLISFSNTYSKDIAYNVTIDTTKATNGSLNIGIKGNGDPASEKTNNWYYVTPCTLEVIADNSSEGEADIPEGYTLYTFAAPSWNPTSETPDTTFAGFSVEGLSATDTVTVSVEPISEAGADWAIAMQANIDGSWPSITDDSIVSFEGTIQELMDQAGVDTVEDLVWINLQMWNVSIGDQIAYKYTITPADETEDEDLISGTTDDGTKYQQLPADDSTSTNNYIGDTYPAKTVIDNKTYANVRDGGENWRIYRAVSTEDLANYSSASVVIKNSDTGKAFKLTTSTVYQVLNDGDPPIDGVVYVVFVINNVSGYHKTSNSYNSDLVWSDITLE